MEPLERLKKLCEEKLSEQDLSSDERYQKRLKAELREADAQNESEYFLDLYDRKVRYSDNQNNLLIPYLLGIVHKVDIDGDVVYMYGDFPDIDTDYVDVVRDYLKEEWAPRVFGAEKVCNIGNYSTFGIKSTFQDMARVYECSRSEIVDITTKLGLKDDEGKGLTFVKALEQYPDLKKYCDNHPEVARAVKKLLHRNRGMGKHAGGLIVCSDRIDDFVPLVKNIKEGTISSAWVEGLHGQDLGPVGLIKFDLLVIKDLKRIGHCCYLIKQRHGLKGVWAKKDQPDWSDTSYKNDPKALEMANRGDLKGVFQFDSDGIRKLAREGGIASFNDLMALTALFRPGPLNCRMHERFIKRKQGRESYTLHPLLEPILNKTYGVICYQEQIMEILNTVGGIPLKDCYIVIKAVAKKKLAYFAPYRDKFLRVGKERLGCTDEQIRDLFSQIESFSEYGFNLSILKGSSIYYKGVDGRVAIKPIEDFVLGDRVFCVDEAGNTVETEVLAVHDHGELPAFEVTFDDGYQVTCTINHKFLTKKGQKPLWEILETNSLILSDPQNKGDLNAEEESGRLDSQVRVVARDSAYENFAREGLFGLSGEIVYDWRVASEVRGGLQIQNCDAQAPVRLSELSAVSLEGNGQWRGCQARGEVRADFYKVQGACGTSSGLSEMYGDKTGEHHSAEYQDEPLRKSAEGIVEGGKKNISQARNSGEASRESAQVAGGESREVCGICQGNDSEIQAIQNGDVAENSVELGAGVCSLWDSGKTGGFRQGQDLDRSRWFLPFQGTSDQQSAAQISRCTVQGCYVERGGSSAWGRDVDSSEHGVFRQFDGSDEAGLLGLAARHAPITNTGRLVSRKIVRVCPVGKRQMYDLEVTASTHNFLLPNGVVTSNSHACAYTYTSSRLLALKAHYPLEFYAATLACEEKSEKVKDYKTEAFIHGIRVEPISLNKSGDVFRIVDDVIYVGFGNIKGIGLEKARKVASGQPYAGFEDFLRRGMTDSKVVRPLLGLRVFNDSDPVTLYRFYECYRDYVKKHGDKVKRANVSLGRYVEELEGLLPAGAESSFTAENLAVWERDYDVDEEREVETLEYTEEQKEILATYKAVCKQDVEMPSPVLEKQKIVATKKWNRWKELKKLWKKWERTRVSLAAALAEDKAPTLATFDPLEWEIKDDIYTELIDPAKCEELYYGFQWTSCIELSPDFSGGHTFNDLRVEQEVWWDQEKPFSFSVEMEVKEVIKKAMKKGGFFYSLKVRDTNGEECTITVWEDDYLRFKEEMIKGNLLKLRVKPPTGDFTSYTFDAPPRWLRERMLPRDKRQDHRLIVMAAPPKEEAAPQSLAKLDSNWDILTEET